MGDRRIPAAPHRKRGFFPPAVSARIAAGKWNQAIQVEVEDDRIIVTVLGTSFRDRLFQIKRPPALKQSPAVSVDKEASKDERRDFEALAWEAANAKARELGWIV